MAGVGMGVMHDAIHGSYSKNPRINKWVGHTLDMVGASSIVLENCSICLASQLYQH